MRKFLGVIAAIFFCGIWPLVLVTTIFQLTFLSDSFYIVTLQKTNAYERSIENVLVSDEVMSDVFKDLTSDLTILNEIRNGLKNHITGAWLQQQVEPTITGILWLSTHQEATLKDLDVNLSIKEIKDAFGETLNGQPEEKDDSGASQWVKDELPDNVQLKYLIASAVNKESGDNTSVFYAEPSADIFQTENSKIIDKQIATIQSSLGVLRSITIFLWIILILSTIALFSFFKGITNKIRGLGRTYIIASIPPLIFAGGMYLTRNVLSELVSRKLENMLPWQSLISDIISELIGKISIYTILPSVVLLVAGIAILFVEKLIRK